MDDVYLKQLRPQISKLLPGRTEQKLQLLNSQCKLRGKGTVKNVIRGANIIVIIMPRLSRLFASL